MTYYSENREKVLQYNINYYWNHREEKLKYNLCIGKKIKKKYIINVNKHKIKN
jgi:hypothetical protein